MSKAERFYILVIFFIGLFLRSYRQSQLLGFFYDQGRDATISQDIITGRNFPAIGPTTGIEGLHLGPFWFYLITPFYFLANGNPAIAAIFVSIIEALTIPLIYITTKKYFLKIPAVLASLIWTFGYYIIRSSRWFSNPTPIPFLVILIIYLLSRIIIDKKYHFLPLLVLLLALSLQLEAASAIFFFPSLFTIVLLNKTSFKKILTKKNILFSSSIFLATLLPQIGFELKNNFPTTKTLIMFLTGQKNSVVGKSWAIPSINFIYQRLGEYYKIFFTKLDTNLTSTSIIFAIFFVFTIIFLIKKYRRNKFIQICLIWLFIPLFCLLFFIGNYGRLYDYYLTGFFVPFVIIFSCFPIIFRHKILKSIAIISFIILFYIGNIPFTKNYLIAGVDGPSHISLGNQNQIIDYLCQDAKNNYNLHIYVPPVIPYSYQYLLDRKIEKNLCLQPSSKTQDLIYIIYEVNLDNPANLENWLNQFSDYQVENQIKFGGINLQKLKNVKK